MNINNLKYFLLIISILSITQFIGAVYAGESYEHDFNHPIINCSITNNTYDLDGLNLSWNDSIATIDTVMGYKSDSFILNCWINESIESVLSSGGHSHKVSIKTNVTPEEVITIIEETPIEEKPISNISTNETDEPLRPGKEKSNIPVWIALVGELILIVITIVIIKKKE